MKTLNLYLDMEFTSLSPDAQPISLAIVTEEHKIRKKPSTWNTSKGELTFPEIGPKTFYAEFRDYDISRCDEWVKENVVEKLRFKHPGANGILVGELSNWTIANDETEVSLNTEAIIEYLKKWISQFSQYQLQFVVDCGTWDWYYFLQLIAEWNELPETRVIPLASIPCDKTLDKFIEEWENADQSLKLVMCHPERVSTFNIRTGLPKLPPNVSPVPTDLNDLIAFRNDITPMEAFSMNREDHLTDLTNTPQGCENKHTALHDATIIKQIHQIYKKL